MWQYSSLEYGQEYGDDGAVKLRPRVADAITAC